jgi:TDG/mug DNA glycosylase family protein
VPHAQHILPDLLQPGLTIVFCGSAAGTVSAQRRAYYAGPGNRFWITLREVGLTDRVLRPEEYRDLLRYGIGLTDVVKTAFGADAEIPQSAFAPEHVSQKLARYRPRIVATNGKRAAEELLGHAVSYGLQRERLSDACVFVLPSTSGRARRFFDLSYWQELARLAEHEKRDRP